ncbi:MAG TPA: hypothetical protein VE592_00360, partial [Geminicoccaceae bacterium]|nr:hypothetical protein [Geminicoccaceae bacterium]
PGEPLTPEHVARLLTSELGALRGCGSSTVVPIINMVDDRSKRAAALETARRALERSDRLARVVLTNMVAPDPVIEVVTP